MAEAVEDDLEADGCPICCEEMENCKCEVCGMCLEITVDFCDCDLCEAVSGDMCKDCCPNNKPNPKRKDED